MIGQTFKFRHLNLTNPLDAREEAQCAMSQHKTSELKDILI